MLPRVRPDITITEAKIRRWRRDFPRFCDDALYVVNKDAETVKFELNTFQRYLWEKVVKPDLDSERPTRVYLLKARQLGSSTFVAALQHWRTILWANSNGLVVAHDLDTAEALFQKQKIFYGMLPTALRPSRKLSNRRELHFGKDDETGTDLGLQSRLQVQTAKDVHIGAGMTLHSLHLSEFARYESVQQNVQLSLATLLQTVPKRAGTFVFLETTAWGLNFSYNLWKDQNEWTKVFVSWLVDPEYTEQVPLKLDELHTAEETKFGNEEGLLPTIELELVKWYEDLYAGPDRADLLRHEALCRLNWRRKKIDLDLLGRKDLFSQEYPTTAEEAFLTSGTNVFDTKKLADYRHAIESESSATTTFLRYHQQDREFLDAAYGDLRIFEQPQRGARYVIGADVGEGLTESDYSVAQVLSVRGLRQVAVYQGRLDPAAFADALHALGRMYNLAHIGVEVNGPGFATNLKLAQGDALQTAYPFVYQRRTFDDKAKRWLRRYGWHTNRGTKNVMITDLRRAIRDDLIQFLDIETINELGWYVQNEKSGKMDAAPGYKDDTVMAMAIALQMYADGNFGSIDESPTLVVPEGSFQWYEQKLDRLADLEDRIGWN